MRAPFQIIAIPYQVQNNEICYCVFHRSDFDQWQFISGGGEDDESPIEAAKREIFEESGIVADGITELKSMCYIPSNVIREEHLRHWKADTYVIPEYSFGFECNDNIILSHEHTECVWLDYGNAREKLTWNSNRTALYELNCRLTGYSNY